jgi:hypothetical protein
MSASTPVMPTARDGDDAGLLVAGGFPTLLDMALERGYLNGLSTVVAFPAPRRLPRPLSWMRLMRLPVHPTRLEDYDLLPRWQAVLSTLHAWGHRLVFVLLRVQSETRIYLGAASPEADVEAATATTQLAQATVAHMPGIDLRPVPRDDERAEILLPIEKLRATAAVTGLPSPRPARGAILQTLDQIAFGIRDEAGHEADYAVVVVADPTGDPELAAAIQTLRALGSQIHSGVRSSVSQSGSSQSTMAVGVDAGEALDKMLREFLPVRLSMNWSRSTGSGWSAQTERLDKVAQFCEDLTERHVARLQQGRNLGFWTTGTYVLAKDETAARTLAGMLRSVYSGDESFLEPIRVHVFGSTSGAEDWIKQFERLPVPDEEGRPWRHPLGAMYEGVATPLNTEELSLTTSLPRRDVPGLRFVRNAVRFASNPPLLAAGARALAFGDVLDMGIPVGSEYAIDVDSLVRHVLVTGVTGSGKSTTCRRILEAAVDQGVPALVVEPAKDEYVRWALERGPGEIRVYMPGGAGLYGDAVEPLHLNPFQPAQVCGMVDIASRCERLCSILTASLPMADVLPLLIEEAIFELLRNQIDVRFDEQDIAAPQAYPLLAQLAPLARRMIAARGYEARVTDNLVAAVETRVAALTRGRRGQILNVVRSTPFDELFERPAVVNLSQITDDRDKALIMALLLLALVEYRVSAYHERPEVKRLADGNHLCHLAVIEEAHRLLARPSADLAGIGNPQGVLGEMFTELLSEVRAYGQGIMIVDQVPGRLVPDAIKNTNLKVVHRLVAEDDRTAMASAMALRAEQATMIAALQPGEAIVCGDMDDAASWIKVPHPARARKEAGSC